MIRVLLSIWVSEENYRVPQKLPFAMFTTCSLLPGKNRRILRVYVWRRSTGVSACDRHEDARMAERLCVRLQIGEDEFNSHSGLMMTGDSHLISVRILGGSLRFYTGSEGFYRVLRTPLPGCGTVTTTPPVERPGSPCPVQMKSRSGSSLDYFLSAGRAGVSSSRRSSWSWNEAGAMIFTAAESIFT